MTVEQLTQELQRRDAQLAQRDAQLAEFDRRLTDRETQLADREAQITELSETIDKLRRQVAWCERQLFGRKSERYEDPNQSSLFAGHAASCGQGEAGAAGEVSDAEAPKVTVPSHERRTTRRGKREPIPDDLPREVIVHDVPQAEQIDPETGEVKLIRIGEEVSETLAFEAGRMYAKRHVRLKYRRVEENLIGDAPEVVIAAAPREGLAKCLADASLLTEIAVGKFVDHLPLDRQVKIYRRRFGVGLSKVSMCRWMQDIGEGILPLLELMKRLLLSHSRIIQHDDTPVRQQEPGRGQTKQCRFWTALGEAGTAGHYVIFDYTQSRARAGPEAWFTGEDGEPLFVGGQLQCDAYGGYAATGGLLDPDGPWRMVHVGCWAHARRKFHDARLNAPAEASHALGVIRQLYDIERAVRDAGDEPRLAARQAQAKPKVDAFFDWCRQQESRVLPRSTIGEAVTYALNQQASLRQYLEAGYRPIDNNACERSLRGLAIGRKNWLFTGSPAGGQAAARLFSLLGSAQLHGVDPRSYLEALLRRLPSTPPDELDQLLPDRWQSSTAKT